MMTPNNNSFLLFCAGAICWLSFSCFSDVKYYDSGLPRDWDYWTPNSQGKVRQSESAAISDFISKNFSFLTRDAEWRERKKTDDSTHAHHFYHLYFKGRRVDGVGLGIHYNRQGWVEYADSDLEKEISLDFKPDSPDLREELTRKVNPKLLERFGRDYQSADWEPILWRGENRPKFVAAYQVRLLFDSPAMEKNIIIEQETAEILSGFEKYRAFEPSDVTTPNVAVFKNCNILADGTGVNPNNVSLSTKDGTNLENSKIHVYREQFESPAYVRRDVTPADYYTGNAHYSPDPNPDVAHYNSDCTGDLTSGTVCANQAFDAVNVYYQMSQYRSFLDIYLADLSVSTDLPGDPLPVVVNSKKVIVDNITTDNAFYYPSTKCGSGFDRCILFLPSSGTCTNCVLGCSGEVTFNNFAREGFTINHEYQHYITDMLSGMEFASGSAYTVADAIHEGYSDYGAASFLSFFNETPVTVGFLPIPACSGYRRDVSVLRPFGKSSKDSDSHFAGLSWASGLWKLRSELSPAVVDKIALKSMYFLGGSPGFVRAIDSLVKADRSLNSGVNERRIKEIFYNSLKFVGESPFKDANNVEANVGFKGCSGVSPFDAETTSSASGFVFLIWGFITLGLGRFLGRRISV